MTTPEKASEPSMEDILASIRKIISDEPVRAPTEKAAAVEASSQTGAGVRASSPAPSRASPTVLKADAANAGAIDAFIDDVVDDPPEPVKSAVSPPRAGPAPAAPTPTASRPAAPMPLAPTSAADGAPQPAAGAAPKASDDHRAAAPLPASPAPAARGASSPGTLPELRPSVDLPRGEPPAPERRSLFPSLGGALAPKMPAPAPAADAPSPGRRTEFTRSTLPPAFEEIIAQRTADAAANALSGADARPIDLSGVVPERPGTGRGMPKLSPPAGEPIGPKRPDERNGTSHHAVSAADVPSSALDEPKPAAARTEPPASAIAGSPPTGPVAKPTGADVPRRGDAAAGASDKGSEPARTASDGRSGGTASTEAFRGAAASKTSAPAPTSPASSATPHTSAVSSPSTSTPAASDGAGGAGTPPASNPPAPDQVRTLEDTLAEVLRPVVRQWVIENMPRIVEEVAKQEVAKLPKPGEEA